MSGIERPFREIVELHQSRVYSIAYRILGDGGTAEEVAQDVFLQLYGAMDSITSEEHLMAWLRRVAVHRATDAWRRRPRALYHASELQEKTAQTLSHDSSSLLPSYVEKLLLSLPATQRAVVLLRYQEDLLPDEIADVLEMPIATVKSHLQRALKLLRSKAEHSRKECARHG